MQCCAHVRVYIFFKGVRYVRILPAVLHPCACVHTCYPNISDTLKEVTPGHTYMRLLENVDIKTHIYAV